MLKANIDLDMKLKTSTSSNCSYIINFTSEKSKFENKNRLDIKNKQVLYILLAKNNIFFTKVRKLLTAFLMYVYNFSNTSKFEIISFLLLCLDINFYLLEYNKYYLFYLYTLINLLGCQKPNFFF